MKTLFAIVAMLVGAGFILMGYSEPDMMWAMLIGAILVYGGYKVLRS